MTLVLMFGTIYIYRYCRRYKDMNKQIKKLGEYISTMAQVRYYNGQDKVMVETLLEVADLLNQFAEAKNKQEQFDKSETALVYMLAKAIRKEEDSETGIE